MPRLNRSRASLLATFILCIPAITLYFLQATTADNHAVALEELFPTQVRNWVRVSSRAQSIEVVSAAQEVGDTQVFEAIYFGTDNQRVMLSVSYGPNQLDSRFNAHRPEYCYQAQGFSVDRTGDRRFEIDSQTVPVRQLLAKKPGRTEQISYWMTLDSQPVLPGIGRMLEQLKRAFNRNIPDGYLVRVSSLEEHSLPNSKTHSAFINDWLTNLPATLQRRFIGDSL